MPQATQDGSHGGIVIDLQDSQEEVHQQDISKDREPQDTFAYDPCGPGPTMIDEGLFAMFGCTFLNHAYKIKHNGVKVQGNFEVCGAKGKCIRWLEFECGNFLLCNDGEVDIIISKTTGSVNTHNKSHQIPDSYPDSLELPLEIRPTKEPAPWNRL